MLALFAPACGGNGAYVQSDRQDDQADRGETNGRTLDFVSNKPEGDDWEIRVRGSSLWASYGDQDEIKSLPPGSHYPQRTGIVMHPLPKNLPSMPNPCAHVPANAWCRGGKPI